MNQPIDAIQGRIAMKRANNYGVSFFDTGLAMFQGLQFEALKLPEATRKLRLQVREFIESELSSHATESDSHRYLPNSDFNAGESLQFSRKLGLQGWIGMTWPKEYGGGERSFLERYVVTEELLAAGAPVGAHWIADRQSGPLFLKFGSEQQRQEYLPRIARGECFFPLV